MVKAENNVIGFYGWKGAGKTTSLTLFMILEYFTGVREKLYSNYRLEVPFSWLSGSDLIHLDRTLDNSALAIDELHEYADSRNSSSLQNKRVADFFLQSRHFNCDIYYSTQFKDQVDKRIRRITDIDVICENLFIDSDNDGDDDIFRLTIKDNRNRDVKVKTMEFYAKPVFDCYDSTERINPFVFSKQEADEWTRNMEKAPVSSGV